MDRYAEALKDYAAEAEFEVYGPVGQRIMHKEKESVRMRRQTPAFVGVLSLIGGSFLLTGGALMLFQHPALALLASLCGTAVFVSILTLLRRS